ncbi:MAG: 6-bladed beta-propeller [Prevotella sp.]
MKTLTERRIFNRLLPVVMIITAGITVACHNRGVNKESMEVKLSKDNLSSIEEVFSEIDICYLGDTVDTEISGVAVSVQMRDGIILVEGSEGVLYVYDYSGHFLGNSKNVRGKGRGEFNIMTGYTYNRYSKQIEVLTPVDLLFYDTNFRFLGKKRIPTEYPEQNKKGTIFRQICDISESRHIMLTSPLEKRQNELVLFDSNLLKEEYCISYNDYEIAEISMQEQSFFELNSQQYLFFPNCVTNKVFIFDSNDESLVSYIKYTGEDLISAEDVKPYKNNRNKMLEYLAFKSAKIIPLRGMGNESLICTLFKAGGTTRDTYTSFFNVKNGNSKTIKNREKGVVNLPIFNRIEGDTLYAIVPPEDVKKMETLSILNKKSRQLIKTAPEDGKYAIAKYILSRRLSN